MSIVFVLNAWASARKIMGSGQTPVLIYFCLFPKNTPFDPYLAVMVLLSTAVFAGSTAAQTFNVQISEINELSVSGNSGNMTVSTSTAGATYLNMATDYTTHYDITTNGTNKKITAQITSGGNMPANMGLDLEINASLGEESSGTLLADSATTLVINISTGTDTGCALNCYLYATAAAGT